MTGPRISRYFSVGQDVYTERSILMRRNLTDGGGGRESFDDLSGGTEVRFAEKVA